MSTLDRERLESVIDQALERAEHAREAIAEQIGAVPLGARRATDEDIAALVEQQVAQHPPALITYEDGSQAVISPYIAALAYVDGGREMLNRYMRARGITGAPDEEAGYG